MKRNHLILVALVALATLCMLCSDNDANKPDVKDTNPVVLDFDPGTDDTLALFLLGLSDRTSDWVVGTFGNIPIGMANKNAHVLTRAFGLDCVVARGAETPYDGHEVTCGDFHGNDGLANLADSLAAAYGVTEEVLASSKRIKELADYICSQPKVTYIAVGPLATLSHLIMDYPDTRQHIDRVLIMGGGIEVFNKDGDKEYNFAGDGLAVKNVFESDLRLVLFPLDITHVRADIQKDDIATLDYSKCPWLKRILEQNYASNCKYTPGVDWAVVHDCLPVLYLLDPTPFEMEQMTLVANSGGHIERAAQGKSVMVAKDLPKGYLTEQVRKALSCR